MPQDFRLSSFLPYRLAVLSERVSRRLTVEYERTHGLSVAEWRVMVHLMNRGVASVRDIHLDANLEKPRVSRAVTRLEEAGFVAKLAGEGDGRLVSISLTARGQAVLDDIIPVVTGIEADLLAEISPQDLSAFYAVMERLHARLDADPEAKPRTALARPPGA